jgi:hypothetical protein
MEMKPYVSHVKEMLEKQGYSPQTIKAVLECFNHPDRATPKKSNQ